MLQRLLSGIDALAVGLGLGFLRFGNGLAGARLLCNPEVREKPLDIEHLAGAGVVVFLVIHGVRALHVLVAHEGADGKVEVLVVPLGDIAPVDDIAHLLGRDEVDVFEVAVQGNFDQFLVERRPDAGNDFLVRARMRHVDKVFPVFHPQFLGR